MRSPRRAHPDLARQDIRAGMRNSILDGVFSIPLTTYSIGIFLTGYALLLGASNFQIGLLASIPLLANLFQMVAAYSITTRGGRRLLTLASAAAARAAFLILVLLPLHYFDSLGDRRVWGMMVIVALASIFGSMAGVGFLSWLSDLVPPALRGRFFGTRNMATEITGMSFAILGGRLLDHWSIRHTASDPGGFMILYGVGAGLALTGVFFLRRMPDVRGGGGAYRQGFWQLVKLPLQDINFRRFALFSASWSFAVNIASPFFAVYMLRDLKMSYTVIALMQTVNSLFIVLGMKMWGGISDRFGSKPILQVSSVAIVLLPALWIFTRPGGYLLIVALHVYGAFFWAGFNLNTNTLLLRLAPREAGPVYLGSFASINGIITAAGPLIGGVLAHLFTPWHLDAGPWAFGGLHFLFLASAGLRWASRPILARVEEAGAKPTRRMIAEVSRTVLPGPLMGLQDTFFSFVLNLARAASFVPRLMGMMSSEGTGEGGGSADGGAPRPGTGGREGPTDER